MDFTVIERNILSTDGEHTLFGKIYLPVGTPRATFQIIHGMSEHIERYTEFCEFLASRGFVVFAHDQLGHGKTAGSKDNLGFIAEKDGDKLLVQDANEYAKELINAYEGIPHILFGHSMGSFVARLVAKKYPEIADLLILAGTGGKQPLAGIGKAITEIGGKLRGAEHKSEVSQKIFLNTYNHNFKDEECDYSWLSRDKERVDEYIEDEQCNYYFSLKSMNDLVVLSTECNTDEWFEAFPKELPTLIISGQYDPVGEDGKGVLEVYKRLESEGVIDVTFKLYAECRHELLSELNKDEVMNDILTWVSNRI